jgi:hypothetical protein
MLITSIRIQSYTASIDPQTASFVASLQIDGVNPPGVIADREGLLLGKPQQGVACEAVVNLSAPVDINRFNKNSFIIYSDGAGSPVTWLPQTLSVFLIDSVGEHHLLGKVSNWPQNNPLRTTGMPAPSYNLGNYFDNPPAAPSAPKIG